MTDSERLDELRALDKSSGDILSDAQRFNEWTGRVSGLLGFDPIARHKFDALCDYIHNEQDGGRWQLYENVIQAEDKMHAIVARAVSELEINRHYPPLSLPQNFSIPDPVVIPDASRFGYPEVDMTRDTEISKHTSEAQRLTGEEGLLWFWHHCHYTSKWKLVGMALPAAGFLLWLGWVANEQEVLRDIGHAFQKIYDTPNRTPDDKAEPKPKPIPPKP